MKITTTQAKSPSLNSADLTVLPVASAGDSDAEKKSGKPKFARAVAKAMRDLDEAAGGLLSDAIAHHQYQPAPRRRLDIHLAGSQKVVRLSGISNEALQGEGDPDSWRRLGGDAYSAARQNKSRRVLVYIPGEASAEAVSAIAEGALLAAYEYLTYKKRPKETHGPRELTIAAEKLNKRQAADAVAAANAVCEAVTLVRDVVNSPPNDLHPAVVVRAARKIATESRGKIKAQVFDKNALRRMGAGALLAVGRAAETGPYLIHLTLKPRRRTRDSKRIVLVGKGITFDSGGLSIKPAKSMEDMKSDMAGAGCVLGVMKALANIGTRHEVHALVPTAENLISSAAVRPGDIVRALNGKSIEVLNTDAEGRLILADALSYSARIKADVIVDLATLTGACVVALGSDYAGLFTDDDEMRETILGLGRRSGELFWPLPLAKEYRSQLDSPIADLRNIGTGGPGASLAALFLQEFVPPGVTWVHLDIAGPAFWTKGDEYTKPGGTGFGARTLIRWLTS